MVTHKKRNGGREQAFGGFIDPQKPGTVLAIYLIQAVGLKNISGGYL
jgi:hypothetical protein